MTEIVHLTYQDVQDLVKMLKRSMVGARFAIQGGGLKTSVDLGMWTVPIGQTQPPANPYPAHYVVADGNALWLDADGTIWHAPLHQDGSVLWSDRAEAEDWSSWADDEADRLRAAVASLPADPR